MPIEAWSDRIWIVTLSPEPALSDDLHAARDRAQVATVAPHLVVDLASVKELNSSNLSQLLRLRKVAIERESKLRLAAPSDTVWALFLTTGLEKVFDFAPDVPTALAGLQMTEQ